MARKPAKNMALRSVVSICRGLRRESFYGQVQQGGGSEGQDEGQDGGSDAAQESCGGDGADRGAQTEDRADQ